MNNQDKIITVVGGTGFIGRYVVKLLAERGYRIQVIARNPDRALHLKTAGVVGQVVITPGNLAKPESIEPRLAGSYAVINLVGILFESINQNFALLHAQGAEKLAKLAKAANCEKFIHLSSLGVEKAARSKYARTKLVGEKAVNAAFPEATILRPSIVIGHEDNFFNRFAAMSRYSPILPLIGGGETRFQPVYVGDVAKAVLNVLERSECQGQTYELGGPKVYTFKELMQFQLQVTHRKNWLVPVPAAFASLMALFAEILPIPPLTRDQVRLLEYDNIVNPDAMTFGHLGITPTSMEVIVPEYLARYRKAKARF